MSPWPLKQDLPAGADPAAIRAELARTGVYAGPADRPGLAQVVARAKGQGLDFEVLVLPPGDYVPTQLRNLATEVAGSDPVTVLAVAPGYAGSYSASISRARLENAQDELDGNPTVAANQFLDRLLAPSVSWTEITAVLSVLVLGAVVVARLSQKCRLVSRKFRPGSREGGRGAVSEPETAVNSGQ
ncbi:DUF6676 family protein [Segniliparus rugosus]|nr:DUF6676 family protein [Segniliparus rugosus]